MSLERLSAPPQENSALRQALPWVILILLVTCVAYLPAISNGFIWDDDSYVTRNPLLFTLDGLWQIWFSTETPQYYPMVFSTFWIEQHIWGLNPAGFHATNILLHAANAVLVWIICRRIGLPGALLAALIFAVHPVHVESVSWITERKNILSGLFYLSALLAFLKFEDRKDFKLYALSILFFVLALFSKTVTSTLPAALLIIRWMRGEKIDRGYVASLLPFFAIGFAMGLVTVWWETNIVGAEGDRWALGYLNRLLLPGRVVFFYIYKLFVPVNLSFVYDRWELDAAALWQWLYPAGLIALFACLWALRARIGRGPIAGLCFFVVTLFPALGFFNVYPFQYSFVADHFQYLASLGVIVTAAGLAATLATKAGRWTRPLQFTAVPAVIALLGILTWNQNHVYRDLETLWRDTIAKSPRAFMPHTNMGVLLYSAGRYDEAKAHYMQALSIKPDSARTQFNLALIDLKKGETEEARERLVLALKADPDYVMAHITLGKILADSGETDEALAHYQKALELVPDQVIAHNNLAALYAKLGDFEKAIVHLERVLKLDPDYELARRNLETILSKTGRKGRGAPTDALKK